MANSNRITIGIPLYNEEEVLQELLSRIVKAIDSLPAYSFELLFVDDGSSDNTRKLLEEFVGKDRRVKVIFFSRNFGHQAAITAILKQAKGDALILLDGDLQDPPELIADLLSKHNEGYDVVYAIRAVRKGNLILRLCYKVYYRLLAKLANCRIPLDSGDFGLISRRVIDVLNSSPEHHRFHRGLRAWAGFRQVGIPVLRPVRFAGTSKYSFVSLLKLGLNGIFSFSIIPLRLASIMGIVAIILCFLFVLYSLYVKIVLDQSPTGFTALIVALVFTSGVQLLTLGIIGEYIGRIYEQTKGRPQYVIEKILKHD